MIDLCFKYLRVGEKFTYEDIEYIKTSHQKGYHFKDGKKVFRYFKKKNLTQTNSELWDKPPIG